MGNIDIIKGHVNELLNNNDDISEIRMNICKGCPIIKKDPVLGYICDSNKYIDINDNVVYTPTSGYVRGCGCRLNAKTRVINGKCIINKW